MIRLVLEHFAERDDYRGNGDACKERGVKGEKPFESRLDRHDKRTWTVDTTSW